MSLEAERYVLENSQARGGERLVLFVLAYHADRVNFECWPSLTTIAKEAGLSRRFTIDILKALAARGEITITGQQEGGKHSSNVYRILVRPTSPPPVVIPTSPGSEAHLTTPSEAHLTTLVRPTSPELPVNNQLEQPENGQIGEPKQARRPKSPPKKSELADPRTNCLQIKLAKAVAGHYPRKEIYDRVIQTLGEHPDGEKLAACRQAWLERGYNGNSWVWLFEWYVSGIPTKRKTNGTTMNNSLENIRAAMEEINGDTH